MNNKKKNLQNLCYLPNAAMVEKVSASMLIEHNTLIVVGNLYQVYALQYGDQTRKKQTP
jgi:hypothetical protein